MLGSVALVVELVDRFRPPTGNIARMKRSLFALFVTAWMAPSWAQLPVKVYAQELVDRVVAIHPDLLVIALSVDGTKGANGTDCTIIASNIGRLGTGCDPVKNSDVAEKDNYVDLNRVVDHIETRFALRDAMGDPVGTINLRWPNRVDQEFALLKPRALSVRDWLAQRILSKANLLDPFPFVNSATTKTHAQRLIDEIQLRDPDVRVLALRGRRTGAGELVVLGSTFGRHGKLADADDLKILNRTEPVTGIFSNGKRFGIDLPFRTATGTVIGTMNVGYRYRNGDDQKQLLAKAMVLRDSLERRVTTAESLQALDP